jgi:hypothetical protein
VELIVHGGPVGSVAVVVVTVTVVVMSDVVSIVVV